MPMSSMLRRLRAVPDKIFERAQEEWTAYRAPLDVADVPRQMPIRVRDAAFTTISAASLKTFIRCGVGLPILQLSRNER